MPETATDKPNSLVIFVDGFPHDLLSGRSFFLGQLQKTGAIQPSIGFSVNLFALMFAGKTPDDIGFFNKWTLLPDLVAGQSNVAVGGGRLRLLALRSGDKIIRRSQKLSRGVHKIRDRLLASPNSANIPFQYLHQFQANEAPQDIDWMFGRPGWSAVLHDKIPGSPLSRDVIAYESAAKAIGASSGDVFATFGSLDYVGHRYGPGSEEFVRQAVQIDSWLQILVEAFIGSRDRYRVVIVSDHGMSKVTRGVQLDLDQLFGRPRAGRYHYFLDSTMARIWTHTQAIKDEITNHLAEEGRGRVLDAEVRAKYGISSSAFGDIIYVLDEGLIFWPGWYGGWFPKGMHGYMPDVPSQAAICAFATNSDEDPALPAASAEIYPFIVAERP